MPGPVHRNLLARARATRIYLVAGVLVGTLTAFLVVAQAWLLSHQIAGVFDTGRLDGLGRTVGLLALVLLGRALLRGINPWLGQRAAALVKGQLRHEVVAARLGRPLDPRTDTGGLVDLVTHGLDALDGYYAKYLPQLLLAVTVPLVVGVAILTSDLWSTLVLVLTVPLIPFFMALIGWATERRMARRWDVQARLAHHFADLVAGLPTLQVFGRARAQAIGLQRIEARNREETMGTLRISFLSSMTLELLSTLSVAIIAVSIGIRTVNGEMDLASGLFLLVLAPEVYLPLRQVGVHYHDSAEGVAAADRAFAEIDAPRMGAGPSSSVSSGTLSSRILPSRILPSGTSPSESLPTDPTVPAVRVRDLQVTYPGADTPALRSLDLDLAPGEFVAVVGPSGGGKSTLLAVLMGFIRPSAGEVLLGGVPLDRVDLAAWRRRVAWVGQTPGLPERTVGANVALGAPGAPVEAIRAALDRAGAAELALDHEVGDESEGLSDGERRRVGLARALLRLSHGGGRLLILDEPTAGLDPDTERRVLATLRDADATTSALVVTHRPAVVAACDRVVTVGPVGVPA
ncbi:thiol reductant ABC exporter subunit CydD [Raineyella sp. W15-4]|uniref:thiol reductant ABC exporter subunit CydD n=1 Tax=Raineyella sp. W15-4 TaxID=3081651 RepID=UPI002955802C|nr:thiol reductant ABC exporter subunit CydD [Raineyella sp. W15-4]WOQ16859.1 thiol reductant ABC exporter subunit CydD [Raineyella sp. W15-4]